MLPLRHTRYWRIGGLVLLVLVLLATLMPAVWFWNNNHSVLGWFENADKWLHLTTFVLLALWFAGQYKRASYWRIAVSLMMFGVLIELCQFMVGYRSADWGDVGANTVGIIIGLLVAVAGLGGWSLRVEDWYTSRLTGESVD